MLCGGARKPGPYHLGRGSAFAARRQPWIDKVMFNLFSSLPLKNKNITAGYLQTLLQVQARDLFTGLIHISDGAAKRGVLFYVQGVGILFYVFEGGHWKSVSRAQISTELEK